MDNGTGVGIFMIIFYILLGVFFLIVYWKLFTKAGQPGWAVLVPFYNIYVMLMIIKSKGWHLVFIFIPLVNFIMPIIWTYKFAKSYTESSGMAVAAIFFPWIVFPILAFGNAKYLG